MATRCSCGGELKPATLTDYSLQPHLGLDIRVARIKGLRCNQCDYQTLDGKGIVAVMHAAAAAIISRDEQLRPEFAVFLRRYLGCTQAELGKRMGTTRKTVNTWENGGVFATTFDFILRTLVYRRLVDELASDELARPLQALEHVHSVKPTRKPLVLDGVPASKGAAA
jgi:hypothetical protein